MLSPRRASRSFLAPLDPTEAIQMDYHSMISGFVGNDGALCVGLVNSVLQTGLRTCRDGYCLCALGVLTCSCM